jgi:hypothetical protein
MQKSRIGRNYNGNVSTAAPQGESALLAEACIDHPIAPNNCNFLHTSLSTP